MKFQHRAIDWCAVLLSTLLLGACVNGAKMERDDDRGSADAHRSAGIRLQLAGEYYRHGQLQTALSEARHALRMQPDFVDAYNMAALIYMELGDAPHAEEYFSHALRLAPKDPELNNNYGWFLCSNGRPELSIAYFETALSDRSYRSPAKAMTNAGLCSLKQGRLTTAETYLNDAFRLEPSNPATVIGLSRLYLRLGDMRRARFFIERATSSEEATAEALWLAIQIEHRSGDRAAESMWATQLRRRFPDSPEFAAYQRGAFNE